MECAGPTSIADELASVPAAELGFLLAEVATVRRYDTTIPDGHGGRREMWVLDPATMACAIEAVKPREPREVGQRLEDFQMSFEITIAATDRLAVKDHLTIRSVTYEVLGEQDETTFGLFNSYWCQIVDDR